jgi:uroporphyrinogen-III decarboxylase
VLTAFEVYYLVDYPAQPIFFYDFAERYLASIRKVHEANLALIRELAKVGCEMVGMGSAGLELLSPRIFDEAIVPFARETTDLVRSLGMFSDYHICGHSRRLLESGRINAIHPTWFETFSTPPCGDNVSLSEGLKSLSPEIISKGNLALQSLRNGTPEDIRAAVRDIIRQSAGRRHIIGQADGTILPGTPIENVRAFAAAAAE